MYFEQEFPPFAGQVPILVVWIICNAIEHIVSRIVFTQISVSSSPLVVHLSLMKCCKVNGLNYVPGAWVDFD